MYEEEQRGYYILSSFWAELDKDQVLGEPASVQTFDMHTCTLEDVQVGGVKRGALPIADGTLMAVTRHGHFVAQK